MGRFTILTVCTGNVCRSPFAEAALRLALDDTAPGEYTISSAGTHALVGEDMTEQTRAQLLQHSVPAGPFTARRLGPSLLDNADLILTATREHRSCVVDLSPAKLRRTFTLREFAGMLDSVEVTPCSTAELWATTLPQLLALRPWRSPDSPEDDDVTDPYRQGNTRYTRMAAEILPAIEQIARFVRTHTAAEPLAGGGLK